MITNKQFKDVAKAIVLLIRDGGFTNRQTMALAKEALEKIDAIPDEEPEDMKWPDRSEKGEIPPNIYKGGAQRISKIVGPGPRTEQDNRKLEEELNVLKEPLRKIKTNDGYILASEDEIDRYWESLRGVRLDKVQQFEDWLKADREKQKSSI